MRLLLNYKGINKIMSKVQNYDQIVQFVHENFFLKMSRWALSYIDSDGDSIALDSDLDVQTMLQTSTRDHLKVYIKDVQPAQGLIKICGQESSQIMDEQKQEPKKQVFELVKEEEKPQIMNEGKKEEKNFQLQNQDKNHCRWKEIWKKKMQEKMAKFVDERVEALIPCLVKKIEEKINKDESKVQEIKSGVAHEQKCTGCGISPIVGIRYKCTKCASFNFCQSCEATIPHDHNMIKMKFLEEVVKVEEQVHKWGRGGWRCHWGRRRPSNEKVLEEEEKPCVSQENNQMKEESDNNLKLTKKCFRMAKFFGGKPQSFRDFVQRNIEMKFNQLTQLYIVENGEGVIKSESTNEKLQERLQKVSFYFNEPKENFVSIVRKLPAANLKQLIKVIQDERKIKMSEDKSEEKSCLGQSEESKIEQIKIQQKEEQKEQKKEQNKEQKKEQKKEQDKKDGVSSENCEQKSFWGYFKKPATTIDVKKKNECIILMKEYFGTENVYEYIKFFDANHELSQEEIIAKYIDQISQ